MLYLVCTLVGAAFLAIGFICGTIVTTRRVPRTLAQLNFDELHDLATRVGEYRR